MHPPGSPDTADQASSRNLPVTESVLVLRLCGGHRSQRRAPPFPLHLLLGSRSVDPPSKGSSGRLLPRRGVFTALAVRSPLSTGTSQSQRSGPQRGRGGAVILGVAPKEEVTRSSWNLCPERSQHVGLDPTLGQALWILGRLSTFSRSHSCPEHKTQNTFTAGVRLPAAVPALCDLKAQRGG